MKQTLAALFSRIYHTNLVIQIIIGIVIGGFIGHAYPLFAQNNLTFLGNLFVQALQAVAPILVFVLVLSSIANHQHGTQTQIKPILFLYILGTFAAALTAVAFSFAFPSHIVLEQANVLHAPQNIGEVFGSLLSKIVANPISALSTGNYIAILVWAIGLGLVIRRGKQTTRDTLTDFSEGVSAMVQVVIHLAPLGIMGKIADTVATTGFHGLLNYVHIVAVLLAAMLTVIFVINPLIVFSKLRTNPYPLIFHCLKESGITAFFTRSSAANIPVNMELCRQLDLNEDTYSVSIPLGATINMAGAAITITTLTLAAVYTQGISVDFPTALLLSLVASVSACGASGVAGGSLMLIPLACSLFGLDNAIASQVVQVGLAISVIQDSAETALNSSTDALYTAACCLEPNTKTALQAEAEV